VRNPKDWITDGLDGLTAGLKECLNILTFDYKDTHGREYLYRGIEIVSKFLHTMP
jgi:hypothetical protein